MFAEGGADWRTSPRAPLGQQLVDEPDESGGAERFREKRNGAALQPRNALGLAADHDDRHLALAGGLGDVIAVAAAQHRIGDDQIDVALAQHRERFNATRRRADPVALLLEHLDEYDDEIAVVFDDKDVSIALAGGHPRP